VKELKEMWLRLAAAAERRNRAVDHYNAMRTTVEKVMDRGDTKKVYAPNGGPKLGAVSMSDPRETAQVADADAFLAWVEKTYPKSVEADVDITGPEDEVKEVLFVHAKHLLTPRKRVAQKLRAEVLEISTRAGQPVGPGGEADVPGIVMAPAAPSRVSFLPDPGAGDAVAALVRSGAIDLPDLFAEPATAGGDE